MSRMSEEYNARFYRGDKYASISNAKRCGELHNWEVTYGYSATADAIINAEKFLIAAGCRAFAYIKIEWCVDGHKLKECRLSDSVRVLGEYEKEENTK